MAVSKKLQDLVVEAVQGDLLNRIEALTADVDSTEVEDLAVARFLSDNGMAWLVAQDQEIEQLRDELGEKSEKHRQDIFEAIKKSKNYKEADYRYTYGLDFKDVKKIAKKEYGNSAMLSLYPKIYFEVEKLQKLIKNSELAIRLATTETKMVAFIQKIFSNYGIEFPEEISVILED